MRIIDSKRGKDYYDGFLLSRYPGKDNLFVREVKEEPVIITPPHWWSKQWDWDNLNPFWPFGLHYGADYITNNRIQKQKEKEGTHFYKEELCFVGFCGMVYPYIKATYFVKNPDHIPGDYNSDSLIKVEDIFYEPREDDRDNIKRVFEQYKNPPQNYQDHWYKMMQEHRSPVFIANPYQMEYSFQSTIIWNPHLKNIHFARVVDQITASQQIYQFFSNLSSPEKPIPKLDNNTMIEVHGFNTKTSFRNNKK